MEWVWFVPPFLCIKYMQPSPEKRYGRIVLGIHSNSHTLHFRTEYCSAVTSGLACTTRAARFPLSWLLALLAHCLAVVCAVGGWLCSAFRVCTRCDVVVVSKKNCWLSKNCRVGFWFLRSWFSSDFVPDTAYYALLMTAPTGIWYWAVCSSVCSVFRLVHFVLYCYYTGMLHVVRCTAVHSTVYWEPLISTHHPFFL